MALSLPFTIESACSDWPHGRHIYRIRIPNPPVDSPPSGPAIIKYLTGPCPRDPARAIPDNRGQLLAFDTVPAGDWNLGHLVRDTQAGGKYALASTSTADVASTLRLYDAGPAWCNTTYDLTTLLDAFYAHRALQPPTTDHPQTDIQCNFHLSGAVLAPRLLLLPSNDPGQAQEHEHKETIAVWAWEPDSQFALANESSMYALLHTTSTTTTTTPPAPRFLGHITDNGTRVVGFVLERLAGVREAGLGDLEGCRAALGRLHALGVAYGVGGLRRHSFLVGEGGEVMMQGFGGAYRVDEDGEGVLDGEMEALERVLGEASEVESGGGAKGVESKI